MCYDQTWDDGERRSSQPLQLGRVSVEARTDSQEGTDTLQELHNASMRLGQQREARKALLQNTHFGHSLAEAS